MKTTLPGDRILNRRKALKLTQRGLAKLVDVSSATISKWESGINEPVGRNLFTLSKVLHVSPAWVMYGDEDKEPVPAEEILITQANQLSPQQIELLDLYNALPDSAKEQLIIELRVKVDDFNNLFEELLRARKNIKSPK